MRKVLALVAAKITIGLVKIMGRKGTNIGGELALRLCSDILTWLGSKVKDKIIFVTGTNGKTSTNNMIYSIVRQSGHSCICNQLGANLDSGLVSAFINNSNLVGDLNADYACLEVDEASLAKIMASIKPHMIVFTNIFRDQLDKYSEIDALINKIKSALKKSGDTVLLLNADDPLLVNLGKQLPNIKYFYGIETTIDMGSRDLTTDNVFCKRCGHRLNYKHYFYGQLGHYTCSRCEFKRPVPDFRAFVKDNKKGGSLEVHGAPMDFKIRFDIESNETYSLYNMLAAVSCCALMGITQKTVVKGLEHYRPQLGRMERFYIQKPITLNLAKNPVGFNESMKIVSQDIHLKTIAIGINDLPQDGQNISWLWDTNFEILLGVDDTIEDYVLFGQRRYDTALRLKYAGIDSDKFIIIEDIRDMVDCIVESQSEVGYVLLNYSLLFDTQKILKRRSKSAKTNPMPPIP